MLWIFNKERRQARALIKLAHKTIKRMGALIDETPNYDEKHLIRGHRKIRREQVSDYDRFFNRKYSESELQSLHPLRHAHILREAMLDELQHFTRTPSEMAKYIRAIRAR